MASCAHAVPITGHATTQRQASGSAYGDNIVPYGKSPTTGLDYTGEYKPLMVQISNASEARPHWNLAEADIVYESIIWGPGHTRYTCIYSDVKPNFVGAIRSVRLHNVELREEWDCPLVFWGGQGATGTSIYDFFIEHKVSKDYRFDGTEMDGKKLGGNGIPMKRTTGEYARVAPHNASADLEMITEYGYPKDLIPRNHAFKFNEVPPVGQDTAVEIRIPYDEEDYCPSYTYDADQMLYVRSYNGKPMYDGVSNKPIVAANVIVQRVRHTYYNNIASRPIINTTGSGVADIFIGGKHIRGKWIRKDLGERTVFVDAAGLEVELLPGKTFIQIISNTLDYTYTREDGTVMKPTIDEDSLTELEMTTPEDDGESDIDDTI